jgi:hypothetical protein
VALVPRRIQSAAKEAAVASRLTTEKQAEKELLR